MTTERIQNLRLTDEELKASPLFRGIADMQFTKVIEGLVEWLEGKVSIGRHHPAYHLHMNLADELRYVLEYPITDSSD